MLSLNSCEKDLYEEALKKDDKSIIRKVNLDDLPFLKNSINEKINKHKLTAKDGDIDYLSLINTTNVYVITDSEGRNTYTFGLKIEEVDKLTNLLIKETGQTLKYSIIEYKSPQYEVWIDDIKNGRMSVITPEIILKDMDGKLQGCISVVVNYMCPSGVHEVGDEEDCTYEGAESHYGWHLFYTVVNNCEGSGGSSGDSSGPGAAGGAGGGGGGSTPPVNTTPVPCLGCVNNENLDPCVSLSNLINPSMGNARDKILAVQNEGVGFDGEKGATFTYSNGIYNSSPIISSTLTTANAYGINFPINPAIYAEVHTHQDNDSQTPMFSFNDLMELNKIYIHTNPENLQNVTFILTLPNSSTFAIKIDNYDSFKNFLNSIIQSPQVEILNSNVDKIKKRNEIFHNMCCSSCNPSNTLSNGDVQDKFIAGFLTTMKNNGVNLFRATGNINGWEKLNAPTNPSNLNYSSTPCNN